MPNDLFSPDYFTARSRFREGAAAWGAQLSAHAVQPQGPRGESLTVDVAALPAAREPEGGVLLVTSGLHGVEGFFGSAAQLAALRAIGAGLESPRTVRVVFIHALNPFGFAQRRRTDENNVDPNRNFLVAGEEYRGSPEGYRRLDPLLNPRRPPRPFDGFYARAALAIAWHGMPALKQAIAEGQYDYPEGLFFGGYAPSATLRLVQEHLPQWLGDCPRVTHLDLHTGLGRWGDYKLLIEQPLSAERRAWLSQTFGPTRWQQSSAEGVSYVSRGTFGRWCASQRPERDYLYLCGEFGTYGGLKMLAGLRAENQATHWAADRPEVVEQARRRLQELFCPASPGWRSQVIGRAVDLVQTALRALANGPM